MPLMIDLKHNERLRINGADLLMSRPVTVTLLNQAAFLFGRQITDLPAPDASPPAQIRYAIQEAYVGDRAMRAHWLDVARDLVELGDGPSAAAVQLAFRGEFYEALQMLDAGRDEVGISDVARGVER